jgi:hypothetical protein
MADRAIATALKISLNTLKEHFAEELENGRHAAQAKVVATMFQIATDKNHPKCMVANMFFQRAYMGVRDMGAVVELPDDEEGGGDGGRVFTIGIGAARGA